MFDRRLVGKTISRIAAASAEQITQELLSDVPLQARVVGVTGAPGAGKSTLIGRLAAHRLRRAAALAILAIDPSSPLSNGSVLGDRIRMGSISEDPRVFIRSLPSRSAQDGLTENTAEIIAALDSFNFDEILVETVGVGQSAYAVRTLVDVEILVLTPCTGDYVQAMKAGIMETADIYVVNKADLPGADRVAADVLAVLQHRTNMPPVIQVRIDDAHGLMQLSAAMDRCFAAQSTPGIRQDRRRALRRFMTQKLIERRLHAVLHGLPDRSWNDPLSDCYRRAMKEVISTLAR